MQKYIFTLLLLLFIKSNWAQNINLDYKRGIKIYNHTEYQKTREITYNAGNSKIIQNSSWKILQPTIAFQWSTKRKNFHEVELIDIGLNKNISKTYYTKLNYMAAGSNITSSYISMRYEFIMNLIKSKDVKWVPSIGFGINPFYNRVKNIPVVSNTFPNYNTTFGTNAFFTPRLTYYTKSKFFIDLNFPTTFFYSGYLVNKMENPSIPIRNQKTKAYDIDFPLLISARLGIGLKF